MEFKWEDIYLLDEESKVRVATWRAKVIDGWLVANVVAGYGNTFTSSMAFIHDPEHLWEITKD